MERNECVNLAAAKLHFLDGWRQVTEILLTVCPDDTLPQSKREQIILELTQELLNKVHIKFYIKTIKINQKLLFTNIIFYFTNYNARRIGQASWPLKGFGQSFT